MRALAIQAAIAAAALGAVPAVSQPFDPGPQVFVPGQSMAGARIGGAPPRPNVGIPNAKIHGDTVEERAYGRPYDDSYLRPKIPKGTPGIEETERRATEGSGRLDDVNAGSFAREGPAAIGSSAVTRGRSKKSHRAIIRR
ncbi:hypothetical protein [Jiella sonneratiae]|uniref:Uncharacterized protein n=1 Tax=Jiella sonneratiae TaxID=2816856 RepID=A0ABS3J7L5_9HYPH|nr:hypothetical protein [Jiella sonneratiae]MBO0905657.1 hypothetical protein [Jiella sonneratiae]